MNQRIQSLHIFDFNNFIITNIVSTQNNVSYNKNFSFNLIIHHLDFLSQAKNINIKF